MYYQFQSKEAIVLEVMRPTFKDVERLVKIADALDGWEARRAVAISALVEMVVRHRQLAVMFHNDPAIDEIIGSQSELKASANRLRELVEGPEPDLMTRIGYSILFGGVGKTAADSLLADIDDADLHRALLGMSNRIMQPVTRSV